MNILVISYSRIGDTILATSLINHLIIENPDAEFTVVTSSISKDIFQDMPQLHNLIIVDKEKRSKHWVKIWKKTRVIKWDLIVDLRSSYLSYFINTKKRMIFRGSENNHKIDQFRKFLKIQKNITPHIWANSEKYKNIIKDKNLSENYICIAPITNWTGKDWLINNYLELFNDPLFNDYQIVILGASDDEKTLSKLDHFKKNLSIEVINLMNCADMIESYFILKKSTLFLGSDSSNMHLSVAAEIPTIGLFGPSNDQVYGPKGENNLTIRGNKSYIDIISDSNFTIEDAPSYLNDIKVDQVLSEIRKII